MDSQKKKSYFVKEAQKQEELKDTVYEKVFQALYWLAEEEIANTKITSLLQLLEKAGVSEIKYFQTKIGASSQRNADNSLLKYRRGIH